MEVKAAAQDAEKAEFTRTRATRRYIPLETVNALVLSEQFYLAHGVVSNISETGACLITNTVIEPGQKLQVRFITGKGVELFQTRARVVWSAEGMDPHMEIVGVMSGVQFLDDSRLLQDKIVEILEKGNFHEVGAADPDATQDAAGLATMESMGSQGP